jgi:phenylalanyl-tRNA synthetase alpha chain
MSIYLELFQNLESVNSCLELRDQIAGSQAFQQIKDKLKDPNLSAQNRKELGQQLNQMKTDLWQACDTKIQEIQKIAEIENYTDFDPTFYSQNYQRTGGSHHPVSAVAKEIVDIFQQMGFVVADGPLVETQDYCFTQLNLPDYHPARSMQDTFYLKQTDDKNQNLVLRTHTSSVQIRYGQSHQPPIYIVCPGQVFRNENIDATHDIIFHQMECLVIDKNVTLAHLKTLIEHLFRAFFGDTKLTARLRPSYFPYTVPSMEIDISNPFKDDPNSRLYGADWIEVGGSGLVHPSVIQNIGLDSQQWQGLAFGFGIDRLTQLKLGLSGLGQFFEGNLNFLRGR